MAGKSRPSLRVKTLQNVAISNLSMTDKQCIQSVFEKFEALSKADVVEVVRCKDCKHSREQDKVWGITDYKCLKHNVSCLSPYDFCSYGERSDT